MKLSELKELGESATSGPWVLDAHQRPNSKHVFFNLKTSDYWILSQYGGEITATGADAALIAVMRNHWDALLQVAEAAQAVMYERRSEGERVSLFCELEKALKKLEKVK